MGPLWQSPGIRCRCRAATGYNWAVSTRAPDPALLDRLEAYYDTVPRTVARVEEVGPFTLFVRSGDGWPFYARPRRGGGSAITAHEVEGLLERQRQLDVPRTLEWVHETTPSLAAAAEQAGLTVFRRQLLVLPATKRPAPQPPAGVGVRLVPLSDPAAPAVRAAVDAAFRGVDDPLSAQELPVGDPAMRLAGAFQGDEPVGGGTHSPRAGVTELTGIAVLPRARRRGVGAALTGALVEDARSEGCDLVFLSAADASVAAIYSRLGFREVATACVAEEAGAP
jgi:ribosomal protein S18 acetylase RimI-like enzyme